MQKMIKIEFAVSGMGCAACSAKIEKELNKIQGIKATVNFASGRAYIESEPSVNPKEIIHIIERLGYKAQELTNGKNEDTNEYSSLKFKAILSCALSAPFIAEMILHWIGISGTFLSNFYLQFLLASIIQFYIGLSFYRKAFSAILSLYADMNVLIAVSTSVSYFTSVCIAFFGKPHMHSIYFESSAIIITLVLLGKFIEYKTTRQSFDAVKKLLKLQPDTAILIITENNQQKENPVPVKDIEKGNILMVKPGDRISVDGIITEGFSDIDESMLSGESVPVTKQIGNTVFAGTINLSGSFKFMATKTGDETVLSKIIKLVSEAQNSKAPIQKLADKISLYFVPAIIIISLITLAAWGFSGEWEKGLINSIAVLIIACPCSLGLATPTALMAGIGLGAKSGIFIKNAEAIQNIGKIDIVIFDKTGTLTQGKLSVSKVIANEINEKELLFFVAQAEKNSNHHIGNAIVGFANDFLKEEIPAAKSIKNFPGKGIEALSNKGIVLVGTEKFLIENGIKVPLTENGTNELRGNTTVFAALNGKYIGAIALKDTPKAEARSVISELKSMNYSVHMLTGDNEFAARTTAEEIGIEYITAGVLPAGKESYIRKLREEERAKVLMAGDGINDAPALISSDIGVAMGTGSDIAIETGDIVISGGNLELLLKAIKISKLIFRTIKQNLFWAFLYNVIAIPFAALGYLNPMVAAAAMALSSISVVLNSFFITLKKS